MGYTHYWNRPAKIEPDTYSGIVEDFKAVYEKSEVKLGDAHGDGEPLIDDEHISFNGLGEDDSHETFLFTVSGRDGFNFCKTANKPYDILVCAALIIAKDYFGKRLKVTSDGDDDDWTDAKILTQEVLGYGDKFIMGKELVKRDFKITYEGYVDGDRPQHVRVGEGELDEDMSDEDLKDLFWESIHNHFQENHHPHSDQENEFVEWAKERIKTTKSDA